SRPKPSAIRVESRGEDLLNNFYIAHSGWERAVSRLPLLALLDVAVTEDPSVALARAEEEFLKGNELCDAKRFEEALGHYDRAVAFGLTDHVAWNNKVEALDS